jgi:UDP-N-acetylmuramyl tripeptide synthase
MFTLSSHATSGSFGLQMTSAAPASRFLFEPDRTRAIRSAVRVAGPDDIVVIAGKGHRRSQEIGGSVLPCDDRRTASAALAACGHRAATDDE